MVTVEFAVGLAVVCAVLGYFVGVYTERDRTNPPPAAGQR